MKGYGCNHNSRRLPRGIDEAYIGFAELLARVCGISTNRNAKRKKLRCCKTPRMSNGQRNPCGDKPFKTVSYGHCALQNRFHKLAISTWVGPIWEALESQVKHHPQKTIASSLVSLLFSWRLSCLPRCHLVRHPQLSVFRTLI